ncbi:SMEK domain-containing protein [Mesorhizobium sp. M5C.F.Ca.ET.164.01.1.1]|uniref:SMEK domain-containing protein n=1 Tax=Mesorhizobium sp. M5C.F.Ca.ET.164.01.1.1 TaxID=2563957 RepID=UPI0011AE44C5|nr:SMEK domain-containing protein [Mesorhizobium sp. M5C.F.Ca.ET.164.01.1.1]
MNSQEYINQIKRYFAHLIVEIKCNNACDHFDINKVAENFFIPILSIVYDCPDLKNQNAIKANFPSVDLGCETTGISFQVTSDGSSSKVIYTLEKFREHKLNAVYNSLFVLIITEKQKSYTSEALKAEIARQTITFATDVHIIDYTDLLAKMATAPISKLKQLCEVLAVEFDRWTDYSQFRSDLDGFLDFSNSKIEVEKRTKKYIPSIFVEPTKAKEITRLFGHPVFFSRKIEDKLRKADYSSINQYLLKVGIGPLQSGIVPLSDTDFPRTLEELFRHLADRRRLIQEEVKRVNPLGFSPKAFCPEYEVAPEKEAIRSLLKMAIEGAASGVEGLYAEALRLINTAESKILLITSSAGQGKTNFICDLIENQFGKFEIPSVFIPARELNKYSHPNRIVSFISQNRYLPRRDNIHAVLDLFNQLSKRIQKPFVIAIDGINEVKDLESFLSEFSDFLNTVYQYEFVKVIITCRTEFFDSKFASLLDEPFADAILRIKDLKADMSDESLERMLSSYLTHFNITVRLSDRAADFLKSDLLMMRIFCDLNEGQDKGILSDIYKVKLYESYLYRKADSLPKELKQEFLTCLYNIVENMLSEDRYHNINVGGYSHQQQQIIDRLVSEDIILRREPAEKMLQTMLDETISFTYDELRDFVIGLYLVKRLAKSDFSKFLETLGRLRTLPIYEGVFKYVYLLARQSNDPSILKNCEAAEDFDVHYSIAIATLPHEYQNEEDRKRVLEYLNIERKSEVVRRIGVFLFERATNEQVLNRRLLIEHINCLGDPDVSKLFFILFRTRAHVPSYETDPIKEFLAAWTDAAATREDFDDDSLTFVIQLSFLANPGQQYELRSTLAQIKGRGKKSACFSFVENARSARIAGFARSIDAFVGASR